MILGWHRNGASRAAGPACVHGPYPTPYFQSTSARADLRLSSRLRLCSRNRRGTDLRPLMIRVSESGDIDPGCAGHRGIARSGDRRAVSTPGFSFGRSRGPRTSTPIATMQHERKPILGREPSRFRGKRQELLRKYISCDDYCDQFVTRGLTGQDTPKPHAGIRRGRV